MIYVYCFANPAEATRDSRRIGQSLGCLGTYEGCSGCVRMCLVFYVGS